MIDAHDIAEVERRAHAGQPPSITVRPVGRPAVKRVAPKLAVRRKIIGRHTGYRQWEKCFGIQFKERRVGPGVGGVGGHENGQIPDDREAAFPGGGANERPLAEEKILAELIGGDGAGQFGAQRRVCGEPVITHRSGPLAPGAAREVVLQGPEIGVSVEPVGVLPAKGGEITVGQCRALADELLVGRAEQRGFQAVQRAVVHAIGGQEGECGKVTGFQQAEGDERGEIDQIRIAGKSGEALVR